MSCFVPSGGNRLREASSVSVSREREPETQPERHPGPPAAAVHHPLAVQHHAHKGEAHGKGWGHHWQDKAGANMWFLICRCRRTKTCAAEYTSWSCPYSSAPNSCRTWRDRAIRASGGEGRSWGNERTEWRSCSSSWTARRAKSQWWRYESCLKTPLK